MYEDFQTTLSIVYMISMLMIGWAIYEITNTIFKKV